METQRALPARFASRARFAGFAAALASFLILAACAPKYYSSNTQNVPLLTHEGEASASASINPGANRVDVRAARAFTHLGVQINGALYFPRDDDSGNGGHGGLFETGLGYYAPLPHRFVFETYGLAALGTVQNHFETANPSGRLNANLVRIALQPALGYKHRYFEAAVSSRVGMLTYFNVDGSLARNGESEAEYLRDHRVQFLAEPAVTVRAGSDVVKAEAQVGWSVNLGDDEFPQDKNWASLGLVYYFNPRR